jgi:hypothetical protein
MLRQIQAEKAIPKKVHEDLERAHAQDVINRKKQSRIPRSAK